MQLHVVLWGVESTRSRLILTAQRNSMLNTKLPIKELKRFYLIIHYEEHHFHRQIYIFLPEEVKIIMNKKTERNLIYLSGNGGSVVDMIVGNDDVVRQNDDVVVNFVGNALGTSRRQTQPYGSTPPRSAQQDQQHPHAHDSNRHHYNELQTQIASRRCQSAIYLQQLNRLTGSGKRWIQIPPFNLAAVFMQTHRFTTVIPIQAYTMQLSICLIFFINKIRKIN